MDGRKQLRKMGIGGTQFVYTSGWLYPEGRRTVVLHAWGPDKAGSPLHAEVATYALTPEGVRAVIEHALARGWEPATRGAPFCLTTAYTSHLAELIAAAVENSLPRASRRPRGAPRDIES